MTPDSPLSLVIYSADAWWHACLVVRLISPAQRAGWALIQGAEWVSGALRVFPERISQADVVVITRDFPAHTSEYQQVMAAAHNYSKTVVYETDDLLLELPKSHPDYERYLAARAAILQAIVEADAVVGSTPDLCNYLRAFNPNTRLWENYLDDHLWQPAHSHLNTSEASFTPGYPPQSPGQPICIGYMGGHSHATDLEPIVPALIHILETYPSSGHPNKVSMKFWGLEPPPGLREHPSVEWIPVRMGDYPGFAAYFSAQKCDIFIAPLQDNLFNCCKSNLKFLEYSALATPGVYSRIAPYQRVVVHGQNGFLAGEPNEWIDCLRLLIEDASLRIRMGNEALATLRSQWLLSGHLDHFNRLYRSFASDTSGKHPQQDAVHLAPRIAQKMSTFYRDLLDKRQEDIRSREQWDELRAQMAEQQRHILRLNHTAQEFGTLYYDIITSRSWRLMQRLIGWRLRLAPRGSRREQIFKAVYQSAAALKNLGVRASLRVARQSIRSIGQTPVQVAVQASPRVQTSLFSGALPAVAACALPAISIIVILNGENTSPSVDETIHWLQQQTLRQAGQIVIWDETAGKAYFLDTPSHSWNAGDLPALISNQNAGIQTPYICLASKDLLKQEATYLETNLCTLQTETLAFTINLCQPTLQTIRRLEQGWLPGNRSLPLARLVVRKECVSRVAGDGQNSGAPITLDLLPWLDNEQVMLDSGQKISNANVIVGKIIALTTNFPDLEGDLPFDQPTGTSLTILDRYLISNSPPESGASPTANIQWVQTVFPLHQVIPAAPEPCDLPTVFLVMPFLAVGGAEKIALKVMQNLAGQVRFVVLTFEELDTHLGTMTDEFRRVTPYVYTLPDFAQNSLNASMLDYLIARFDPCTIYIANGTPWIYEVLGEIKTRYPHIRLVNQVYDHQVGWINRYDPTLVLYLDVHIGSNPRICQAYRQKGVRPEQIYFIENGSDPQELDPGKYDDNQRFNLRLKLGLPAQARMVTFASRMHPQKRPLDFVELARRFSSDSEPVFLMAGDGPLAGQVDEQIRKTGLQNIHRIPFYQPVSDLLAVTDVLVLPSEFEGMPMIVLEAQTMGVPVVVTDVGNNREIIERTQGGIVLSQIGDVSALMSAVRQMLDHPPDPMTLRHNTLVHFDWKIVAQKYLAALLDKCSD